MRAIAILGVVLYHAGIGFPGGYTGVDIFFVISGFLITSIIVKEIRENRFSFVAFWERRIRRIFPALFVMMGVTWGISFFALLPSDFRSLGWAVLAQLLFVANFFYLRNTNYFADPAEDELLLHTWSLSLEEQYYVVVPVLVVAAMWVWRSRALPKLWILFLLLGITSLALSAATLAKFPAATFYLLPTRAWELVCGSALAVFPSGRSRHSLKFQNLICSVGLLAMVVPMVGLTSDTPFPGIAALPSCIGTAFVIYGSATTSAGRTLVASLLGKSPMVAIGKVSYSWYLWHWPLFALSHYWALGELTLLSRVTMVVASLCLASISYRWIEQPFRNGTLLKSRRSVFRFAMMGGTSLVAISLLSVLTDGLPGRFVPQIVEINSLKKRELASPLCGPVLVAHVAEARVPTFGNKEKVEVLVWGDSHARSIAPAVIEAASDTNNGVALIWHSSTPPVFEYALDQNAFRYSLGNDLPEWSHAVLQFVTDQRISRVLLAARWNEHFQYQHEMMHSGAWKEAKFTQALLKTVDALRNSGAVVWILREVPCQSFEVPRAVAGEQLFGWSLDKHLRSESEHAVACEQFDRLAPMLEERGATIVDPATSLLKVDTLGVSRYKIDDDGVPFFYDDQHLSQRGARSFKEHFTMFVTD